MFLSKLTPTEQNSFLALATRMILADGNVDPAESEVIAAMKDEMGGKALAPPEEVIGVINADAFTSDASRFITVLELAIIAYADGSMHEEEFKIVEEAIEAFKLTPVDVDRVKTVARREADLVIEALALTEANGD